jgi:cytoskeletal protein CcmA (bactofilin family)
LALSDDNLQIVFKGRKSIMLRLGNRDTKAPVQNTTTSVTPTTVTTPAPQTPCAAKATVIGESIAIDGTIQAGEDIIIEGSFKGSILAKSHQVTVGKNGRVEATIQAENVVISGRMKGEITAFNKVQITQGADFNGQIKAKSIAVEDGAFLKASIELDKEISEKTHTATPRRIDAIVFPAEGHGEKIPIHEIAQPNCKN